MTSSPSLRQLACLVALADMCHYRRAAERMGISQSSLSQQILGLEAVLELELVERGQRGAVLTPQGRMVLVQARKVLDEAERLSSLAREAKGGASGTIRLGSTPTIGPYVLPHVMRRIHQSYPALKVIVRDATPLVLQDELLAGQHDLILTQLPVNSADVEVRRLFREPLKLAVAQDHPLAAGSEVLDADLEGQEVLALSRSYLLHNQIVGLCEEVGAHIRQDYEGTSLDALRQMTALNMGISFLPALYVRSEVSAETGDVVVLPFRRNRLTRSIGLAWRRRSAHQGMIDRIASVIRAVAQDRFGGLVTVE